LAYILIIADDAYGNKSKVQKSSGFKRRWNRLFKKKRKVVYKELFDDEFLISDE
jgi:hypothetical protein